MSTTIPSLIKLPTSTFRALVNRLINAKMEKKEADATSRSAESTIKSTVSELLTAMNGAPVAMVGDAVLVHKTTNASEAAITLKDGSRILWGDVTAVLIGNRQITRDKISKIYGGRDGSETIEVTGKV